MHKIITQNGAKLISNKHLSKLMDITTWEKIVIHPSEALNPKLIIAKERHGISIAGSVGRQISTGKPGINEDGGSIFVGSGFLFAILIDGHYSRDTTEIIQDKFQSDLELTTMNPNYDSFIDFVNRFGEGVVNELKQRNAVGEASFLVVCVNITRLELYYHLVGDVMIFIRDPERRWGKYYQISNRHYFEWINKNGIMGKHSGFLKLSNQQDILLATDGLIDEPVISMPMIEKLFDNAGNGNKAENLVRFALENNTEDDNITVIYLKLDGLEV